MTVDARGIQGHEDRVAEELSRGLWNETDPLCNQGSCFEIKNDGIQVSRLGSRFKSGDLLKKKAPSVYMRLSVYSFSIYFGLRVRDHTV